MDNDQYLIQRKKLKYLLSYSVSDNVGQLEAITVDLWHQMESLLNSEQIYDANMLFSSYNVIQLFEEMKKANLIDDPCDRLDYSFESLKYISNIISQVKYDLIDTESVSFLTVCSPLYSIILSRCFLPNGSPIHPEDQKNFTAESVIDNLSLLLGAYVGECMLENLGKGCWEMPQNGQLSALSFVCKNGYIYKANPIGIIYTDFYDNFVTTNIEELADHIQNNHIMLKIAMLIATVKKFDIEDSSKKLDDALKEIEQIEDEELQKKAEDRLKKTNNIWVTSEEVFGSRTATQENPYEKMSDEELFD